MEEWSPWEIFSNLLFASRWTVALSVLTFVGGGVVGLVLTFMRVSRIAALERIARLYIELIQGTPLLIQLFLIYFGIALTGIEVNPLLAAGLGLTLWSAAYLTEIWRGCVEAIARGQWEASSSLALSFYQQMRHVILPQALRIAIPPTVGFSVQVVKGTAVASIIGFVELTKASTMLNNATFQPFMVFSMCALLYFAMCFSLSLCSKHLEKRLNVSR